MIAPFHLRVAALGLLSVIGWQSAAEAVVSVAVSPTFNYVVTDGGDGGYEAFPDVTRLTDGRLMTVFYEGYTHISTPNASYPNGGRIMYATSSNEGATWSAPSVLYDSPLDDRDPSITQLPSGNVTLQLFHVCQRPESGRVSGAFEQCGRHVVLAPTAWPPLRTSSVHQFAGCPTADWWRGCITRTTPLAWRMAR